MFVDVRRALSLEMPHALSSILFAGKNARQTSQNEEILVINGYDHPNCLDVNYDP